MGEPVKRMYVIQENCPKDIQLMAIWAQAADDYTSELTTTQYRAAVNWFKSYIDSKMDDIDL